MGSVSREKVVFMCVLGRGFLDSSSGTLCSGRKRPRGQPRLYVQLIAHHQATRGILELVQSDELSEACRFAT